VLWTFNDGPSDHLEYMNIYDNLESRFEVYGVHDFYLCMYSRIRYLQDTWYIVFQRTYLSYGYGSIPINTMFSGLFTSIYHPSYFDVNYRGTIGFDTLPYSAGYMVYRCI